MLWTEASHNLLAISDLHLGCDLKQAHPPAADDAALVAWLDHHAARREGGRPWRLLLVGDVLDFISVVGVPEDPCFAVSEEERRFGLNPEEDKSVWKLVQITRHHRAAFAALARFVARGHEVVFVRGNHDLELSWPAVQRALRERLARGQAGPRVQFHDRAYHEAGRAYVEHGHAYDCFSLPEAHQPGDRVLSLPVSSLVLRYFANRHAGQRAIEQASSWGAWGYLRWFARTHAPWRVALDYVAMIARILGMHARPFRTRRRDALEPLREQLLAVAPEDRQAPADLESLAVEPALWSIVRVMQLFYLERIALVLAALGTVPWLLRSFPGAVGVGLSLGVGAVLELLLPALARARRTESHPLLERAAHQLADLFGVYWVVMGHTHRAVDLPVGRRGARYVNLGSWTHPGALGFPYLVVAPHVSGLRHWPARAPAPVALPELEPALSAKSA
jgi:UDP-2,3-diacylglucosamine pyrophosphatase LpxH